MTYYNVIIQDSKNIGLSENNRININKYEKTLTKLNKYSTEKNHSTVMKLNMYVD